MTASKKAEFQPSSIVLVKFPFTDLESSKKRPALVLKSIPYSKSSTLVIVTMITSRIEGPALEGDLMMAHWKESGLLHPSKIRLAKIATLEHSLIDKKIGVLQKGDEKKARAEIRKLLNSWLS